MAETTKVRVEYEDGEVVEVQGDRIICLVSDAEKSTTLLHGEFTERNRASMLVGLLKEFSVGELVFSITMAASALKDN